MVTNVEGNKEVINYEDNGFIVQPKNSKAIFDAINRLILDKDLRKHVSYRGKKSITDYSTRNRVIKIKIHL